ncbi:MAG: hypothetical protein ACLGPL_06505 [Acidobacteriota bacterium]
MKDDTGYRNRVSVKPHESEGIREGGVPPMDVSRIIIQVLERIRQEIPTPRLLKEVVGLLADWTGFEAIGMRLKEGDDYPYFQTRGMSEDFVRLENSLCPQGHSQKCAEKGELTLECVCGSVLQGRIDRSEPLSITMEAFGPTATRVFSMKGPSYGIPCAEAA